MKQAKKQGFTLIELMIVIAIIAIIAAIAIPGLLSSQRAANERNASTSLKTLTSAEADFRANDRDGNRVNDFWTQDVKGLYTLSNYGAGGANVTTMIKLIELSLAGADAELAATSAGNCVNITQVTVPSAKSGFWYQALLSDMSAVGTEQTYKLNTSGVDNTGTTLSVTNFNTSKFGFTAWPDSASAGKYAFIVNEGNTIFRRALTSTLRPGTANPPGLQVIFNVWPDDTTLKAYWSKLD
jgi:prepilin-type N-terminal cleavage/methylation domain-containing protein